MELVPLQYLTCDAPWPPDAKSRVLRRAEWMPEMMLGGQMVVYANPWRSVEFVATIEDLGNGAGRIACRDCDGNGIYCGAPQSMVCGRCKGSGFDYVSI